jgi:ubiquinone/menaquinone biosynthesis C-methylase UbiE
MIVNPKEMINNIDAFIDFSNKTVMIVGAGGGQLMGYAGTANQIIAVDNNKEAIEQLEKRIRNSELINKYKTIMSDFESVNEKVDILVFEFSLHEMENIQKAIEHAKEIAGRVIIFDHVYDSEWVTIVQENNKIETEDKILNSIAVIRQAHFHAMQAFVQYDDLKKKVECQGEGAIKAIRKYLDKEDITIDMEYKLVEI